MILIGLSGRARGGKTTVADTIVGAARDRSLTAATYDIGAIILKYCINSHRIPKKSREALNKEELQIMVEVGFEKRQDDPKFWLDSLLADIVGTAPDVAVVPNVRYRNEVDFIHDNGGVVCFVTRLNQNGSQYISLDRDPNHVSESGLFPQHADYFITAKGSAVDWLRIQAKGLLQHLLGGGQL